MRWTAALTVFGLALMPSGVNAQEPRSFADRLALEPIQWEFDNTEIRVGGFAGGALFTASQEGGPNFVDGYENSGASALLTGNIRMQKTFDTGLVLGARGDVLIYRDRLSSDNYDDDTVQRLYMFVQTGFGRVEVGQVDGAAFTLGLTGPLVDQQVTLEGRNISLFRDPTTGEDLGAFFQQITMVQSSSNYAKINYVSPRLFGIQIGAAFTPQAVRTPLPFTGNPSDAPNQQRAIWEIAASYTGYFSGWAVGVTGGFAHGRLMNRTPGHDNLVDWAVGTQLAYNIDDAKISFGGAYRGTNAHLLDIEEVRDDSRSRMVQLSATFEKPTWLVGAEFSHADIAGVDAYTINGFQVAAGYKVNANMQLSIGWQYQDYNRSAGLFYNGRSGINMNGGFLSLGYTL
jgi:outer membrane protein OmpU